MKKLLVILSIITILSSCSDDIEQKTGISQVNNVINTECYSISGDEASAIALNMANKHAMFTRSEETVKIKDVYAWRGQEIWGNRQSTCSSSDSCLPDTIMYIVNFEDNKGFALVAADKRIGDVIALIDAGHLTPDENIENPGFRIYLDLLQSYCSRKTREKTVTTRTRSGESGYGEWEEIGRVNRFVLTGWYQTTPFNDQCPTINGQHCLAGCGAIAAAQIMAYHRMPLSHNDYYFLWDDIDPTADVPSTSAGRESAATLVHKIGVQQDMNYGLNGSGTTFQCIVNSFEDMGYQYDISSTSYDIYDIIYELDNHYPILITAFDLYAGGHAWVLDGYLLYAREIYGSTSTDPYEYQDYLHCNWGWGGSQNGFFLSPVFNYGSYYFNYNIKLLYYIRPSSANM